MDKIKTSDFISMLKEKVLEYEELYSQKNPHGNEEDNLIKQMDYFQKWFMSYGVIEKYFNYLVDYFNLAKIEDSRIPNQYLIEKLCQETIDEIKEEGPIYINKLEKLADLINQYINLKEAYEKV